MDGEYLDLEPRARFVTSMLWGCAVMSLVLGISAWLELSLLSELQASLLPGGGAKEGFDAAGWEARAESNDSRQMMLGLGQFVVFLVTAVAFLRWFRRAYQNLPALGHESMAHSVGWASWGWFVPIINLVRPYQIAKEIWIASDPQPDDSKLWSVPKTGLLRMWWALWIIDNVINQVLLRVNLRAEEVPEMIFGDYLALIEMPFGILSAILAIKVVHALTERQTLRYQRLTGLSTSAQSQRIS